MKKKEKEKALSILSTINNLANKLYTLNVGARKIISDACDRALECIESIQDDDNNITTCVKELLDKYDWELILYHMNDDLREKVHAEIAPCSNEEFLQRYIELHKETFGEIFTIN